MPRPGLTLRLPDRTIGGRNRSQVRAMTHVLHVAAGHALRYVETASARPIAPVCERNRAADRAYQSRSPAVGRTTRTVIDELVRDVRADCSGSTSGRFFGWVIGGTLRCSRGRLAHLRLGSERCLERHRARRSGRRGGLRRMDERAPRHSANRVFAFVTGCQMAHTTALAAARHKLLPIALDVEEGLAGRRTSAS